MPNIKSAKKRLRQSIKRTERNRAIKSTLKTELKDAKAAIGSNDKAKALAAVKSASSRLDSTASKRVIHKNAARRKKSRLMKAVNKLS